MPNPVTTTVLPTNSPPLFQAAVEQAVERLRAGEVVALPTETVYGLCANALSAEAVARIYEIKGRPAYNPIIVHIVGREMARKCTDGWTDIADRLAQAFWPGPLTLVLPRSSAIPEIVTAGGPTVGIRWPGHPLTQAVIRACEFPLAAPSANRSNEISPTRAEHVLQSLKGKIPLLIDGGPCQIGIESTVLDLTVDPPRILRPGMIHEESLRSILPHLKSAEASPQALDSLRSPGLLDRHYAPKAKLHVLTWSNDQELEEHLLRLKASADTRILAHTHIPSMQWAQRVSVIPHDPEAFARALYAELHRCDAEGAACIIVEAVPGTPPWQGIADRLRRASAD